jgi:hypothetical protein
MLRGRLSGATPTISRSKTLYCVPITIGIDEFFVMIAQATVSVSVGAYGKPPDLVARDLARQEPKTLTADPHSAALISTVRKRSMGAGFHTPLPEGSELAA